MHRRQFLGAAAGAVALPLASSSLISSALAQPVQRFADGWRTFEITTRVNIEFPKGITRVWLPLPMSESNAANDYQRVLSTATTAPGAVIRTDTEARYKTAMLVAEWPQAAAAMPTLELVTLVQTRDRHVDLAKSAGQGSTVAAKAEDRALWLQPTELLPTDGIVRQKAEEITGRLPSSADTIARARAIYDWVVENTFRNPQTRGCGVGDVKYMLETNNLGGKCVDINSVFVALARAAGIPARDVYGIRVAASARGYKSLGKNGDITKGQHCRAEFYAPGHGWIPVDPADVRKVMLEEDKGEKGGGLPLTDPKVAAIRDYLFGNWEMNWVAFNRGHDLVLPGSALGVQATAGFLMYPHGETAEGRLDSLDPENFTYRIAAREIVA